MLYKLDELTVIGKGGEATVYQLSEKLCLKIFNNNNNNKSYYDVVMREKLQYFVNENTVSNCAFPEQLYYDENGKLVGYIMKYLPNTKNLIEIYTPILRKKYNLNIDYRFLCLVAINLCKVIKSIHDKNYVICDLKPQNILVDNRANVYIIDADSFQFGDYDCNTFTPSYDPPEILESNIRKNQSTGHDIFRLSILLYQIFYDGKHPFSVGNNNIIDNIKNNINIFDYNNIEILNSEILNLIKLGLDRNIKFRPKIETFISELTNNYKNIKNCSTNNLHYYSLLEKCPYCDLENIKVQNTHNFLVKNLTKDLFYFYINKKVSVEGTFYIKEYKKEIRLYPIILTNNHDFNFYIEIKRRDMEDSLYSFINNFMGIYFDARIKGFLFLNKRRNKDIFTIKVSNRVQIELN